MKSTAVQHRYRLRNLDSAFQAERWKSLNPLLDRQSDIADLFSGNGEICKAVLCQNPQILSEMNRVVRSALLYEDNLIIDGHDLLDGIFFMSIGPDYFRSFIDDRQLSPLRLIVETRQQTLEETLKKFIRSSISPNHSRIFSVLSAIDPKHDRFAFNELSFRQRASLHRLDKAADGEVAKRAAYALEECVGLRHGALAFMQKRWEQWFQAEHDGIIQVEGLHQREWNLRVSEFKTGIREVIEEHKRGGVFYICEDPALIDKHDKNSVCSVELDAERKQFVLHMIDDLSCKTSRSDAYAAITYARHGDAATRLQLTQGLFDRLRDWYDTCYEIELSRQRDAELLVINTAQIEKNDHSKQSGYTQSMFDRSYIYWMNDPENRNKSLDNQPIR